MAMMKLLPLFCLSLPVIAGAAPTSASALASDPDVGNSGFRPGHAHELFLRKILDQSSDYGNFSAYSATPKTEPLTVGIVGAGAAGLYAAMILQSLDMDYEILEADTRI